MDGAGLSHHCLNKRNFFSQLSITAHVAKLMYFILSFFPKNVQNEYLIYSHFPTLNFCCTSFPNGPLVKEDNISLGSRRNTNLYITLDLINWFQKLTSFFSGSRGTYAARIVWYLLVPPELLEENSWHLFPPKYVLHRSPNELISTPNIKTKKWKKNTVRIVWEGTKAPTLKSQKMSFFWWKLDIIMNNRALLCQLNGC